MIRSKFLTLCIALITFISIVNCLTVSHVIKGTIDDEVKRNFELITDQQCEEVNQIVSSLRSNALDLCSATYVQELMTVTEDSLSQESDYIVTLLEAVQDSASKSGFEQIELVVLLQDQPCVWNKDTGCLEYRSDYLSEEWYQQTSETPDRLLFFSTQPGQIYITKGVYDINDWSRLAGYISLEVDTSLLMSALQMKEGTTFLMDENNRLIYPFVDYYQLSDLLTTKGISEFVDIHDREYLLLSKNISANNWTMKSLLPTADLYAKGDLVMKTFVLTAIVTILLAIVITLYLSNSITKPLLQLTRKMQSYEENTLPPTDLPEQYTGEVRILYESYNRMIDHIHSLINEIYITKIEEQEAEMRALQAQINPHFIYNTLDSINWMAAKYQATEIQNMIFLLASMLRHSLNNGENEISIRGELEQLKSYLGIHQIRTPDCFQVVYNVDEALLDRHIIKLMLQPLVENTIEHGFSDIDYLGLIWINIFRDEDHIVLQVINNGKAPDMDKINRLLNADNQEKPKSYGIRNVNTRLIKRYGPEYQIHYEYRDHRTICTIRIPYRET